MKHPLLYGRFLFIVDDCPKCLIYKEFIDRINMEIDPRKWIRIIDCTRFHEFGIIDNPIMRLFYKYVDGRYPVLFFEGRRKDGTSTRVEAEAWVRARVHDDFREERKNEYMFNKECEYVKKGILKNKISCI